MSSSLIDILIATGPILLLVAAWYVFMRVATGPKSAQARQLEFSERQVRALERIADALEKRGA